MPRPAPPQNPPNTSAEHLLCVGPGLGTGTRQRTRNLIHAPPLNLELCSSSEQGSRHMAKRPTRDTVLGRRGHSHLWQHEPACGTCSQEPGHFSQGRRGVWQAEGVFQVNVRLGTERQVHLLPVGSKRLKTPPSVTRSSAEGKLYPLIQSYGCCLAGEQETARIVKQARREKGGVSPGGALHHSSPRTAMTQT